MEGGDFRMSNIDQRVVQMLFDNTSFEHNAAVTLGTMDKLNKGLSLEGAAKGFASLGEAVKSVTMDPLANGVDHVASRFTALSVIGYTVLSNLTNKIVDVGLQMAKSLTIDPIKAGFQNYETQINAVQTILANTASEGTKIGDVNKALAELNTYANQTVYNFSEMTQNIGTFTAAGVDLKTSVESIKGIANLAALSGASSQQASTAMYQLSQAIASGKVQLQDWNSVVNAGLGGKVFQTALENTARAAGTNIDAIIKKAGSFRNSLQEGWLTSDILTKTLSQFTGDLSAAQLKAMGFTAQQAKQIQALGQTALGSATHIKTMTQLADALKEEVATAYGAIFKTIFGNIDQATNLFTKVHNVAENALTGPVYALNNLLEGWAKLGGRTELIKAFGQAFQDLGLIMKPIGEAFRDVFPPATAQSLKHLTDVFEQLTEKFKIGAHTSADLRQIFDGLFSAVKIVYDILVKLGQTFEAVFGSSVSRGSSNLLDFGARVGDFLVRLKEAVETGQRFNEFFVKLQEVLQVPITLVKALGLLLRDLFDKLDVGDKAQKSIGSVKDSLSSVLSESKLLAAAFDYVRDHIDAFYHGVQPLADKISKAFENMAKSFTNGSAGIDFTGLLRVVDTGLFGGLIVLLKKFVDYVGSGHKPGVINGFLDTIKESFEGLTKTLESMQTTLKAATLLEIAAAIAILAVAADKLSAINGPALERSTTALAVMFTQLITSMGIFQKFIGSEGFVKMPVMMLSLILLAGAIDVLSGSVIKLGKEDWNSLAKGLLAISVMLTTLAFSVNLMGDSNHMIAVGFGVASIGKGVKILGDVLVQLGGISWEELGKGLTGLAGVLGALTLFSVIADADTAGAGTGLGVTILAYGILILAKAVKEIGQYSWTTIAKGLDLMAGSLAAIGLVLKLVPPSSVFSAAGVLIVASSLGLIGNALDKMGKETWSQGAHGLALMAGALTLIAGALYLLPPSSLLSAAAIFIVAASLGMITDALGKMGAQSWTEIAKGLTELAGALVLIAGAAILMTEALPGAAALLVMAAAIDILAPALKTMGDMSWGNILSSLVELAGVFVVLALGGALIEPVIPVLFSLAGAVALLGLGALSAGLGLVFLSTGYTALAVGMAANTASMVFAITSFLNLIPIAAKQFALGLVVFVETLAQSAPAIAKAFLTLFSTILDTLGKLVPKVVDLFLKLLTQLLQTAAKYIPQLIDAGVNLISGFLEGLARNMPKIVQSATDLIVAFTKGISDNLPKIVQSAFDMTIKFITSLGQGFKQNTPKVVTALIQMGGDMIDGLIQGLEAGASKVADTLLQIAKDSIKAPLHWLGINSPSTRYAEMGFWCMAGWGMGVEDNSGIVIDAHSKVAKNAFDVVSQSMSLIGDHFDAVEFNPKIKPVLDMSNFNGSVFDVSDPAHPINLSNPASYYGATNASEGYLRNNSRNTSTDNTFNRQPMTPTYNFTQNNYSPKALSDTEIYRQTNNQLSAVRGTLVYQSGGTQ